MKRKAESIVVRGCGSTLRSECFARADYCTHVPLGGHRGEKEKSDSSHLRIPSYIVSINWGIRVYVTLLQKMEENLKYKGLPLGQPRNFPLL